MLNKQGQVGVFGSIILFIFFLIIWFVWLASWLNQVGAAVVATDNLTGFEAFFFMNLNFVVFIAMVIAMFASAYFLSQGG